MSESTRKKYTANGGFYGKLLAAAYGDIRGQTAAVRKKFGQFCGDSGEASAVWRLIEDFIAANETYAVAEEIYRMSVVDFMFLREIAAVIEKRWCPVEMDWRALEAGRKKKEAALKEAKRVILRRQGELRAVLRKTVRDGGEYGLFWDMIQFLAGQRKKYAVNEGIYEISRAEYTAGQGLIDMVMGKRIKIVADYSMLDWRKAKYDARGKKKKNGKK